jgi:CPA2 family monovalent cation:H+ antiporter-2
VIDLGILGTVISILFAALIVGIFFRYLKLPTILGYLLVGALTGPHAFGLIPDEQNINKLAEFGIVLLMFTVGLEFSLPKLIALRYRVFGVGGMQVLIGIAMTTLIGMALGMTLISAFTVGGIVVMSSTAIVMRLFAEQGEIYSKVGQNAVGILLAQDLAVIPFIILLASFSDDVTRNPWVEIGLAVFNSLLAFLLIFVSRRWILKPLFRIVSITRAVELFTLLVLLVALATAWLTHQLGLSYALGAFLAGVMLSETEFRHQIEVEIRPFRDILLGLFFVTIGMLMDVTVWHSTWVWILLLVTALVFCKIVLVALLCRVAGDDYLSSLRTGIVLAQGGEFSFVILTFAMSEKLLPIDYGQVVLAALWISIAISPLLIRYNKKIAAWFIPKSLQLGECQIEKAVAWISHELRNHIILAGFGHVGQHIGRLLEIEDISFIALELDVLLVREANAAGKRVTYGDASHPGILQAAGISLAKAIVISFSDFQTANRILGIVRQLNTKIAILVRCKDEDEITQLKNSGATCVVAEVYEESLSLAHHLLEVMHIPEKRILTIMQQMRKQDYV